MTVQTLNLYDVLASTLNVDSSKAIINYFDQISKPMIEEQISTSIKHCATKEDLLRVENSMDKFATKEDLLRVEIKLERQMAEMKADLMKWMFIFIIGQTALLVGLIKFIL